MSRITIEKIVYFVRHGQSEHNVAPVFQSPESPLSEKGKEQAESVADRIKKISFDALIASPFQRAKETVEAIERATGKTADFSNLFVERIKPTRLNSKPYGDEAAEELYARWNESLYTEGEHVEDGENFNDMMARADAALAYLQGRPEHTFVVVTHGFFLRCLIARVILAELVSGPALLNIQKALTTENTGITVLRYETGFNEGARWRLWIYNDHSHLG